MAKLHKALAKQYALFYPTARIGVVMPSGSAGSQEDMAIASAEGASAEMQIEAASISRKKAWFSWNADDPSDFERYKALSDTPYYEVCEAIDDLEAYARQHGPFDAVVGFSQGAKMAAFLVAHAAHTPDSPFRSLHCAVLVSGYLHPLPSNPEVAQWYSGEQGSIALPSLHLWGTADLCIRNEESQGLARAFVNAQVHVHEKGHSIPDKAKEKDVIVQFLQQHLTV
eukprot:GGOE01037134.1.p1 GENE.GGOE01037134.1~~GGOE01037134.1.p1  ORF type:complete len:262 (-),score=62.58 GGOE01037134.1:164-841(-)